VNKFNACIQARKWTVRRYHGDLYIVSTYNNLTCRWYDSPPANHITTRNKMLVTRTRIALSLLGLDWTKAHTYTGPLKTRVNKAIADQGIK